MTVHSLPLKGGRSLILRVMHDRDAKRMVNFKDITDAKSKSINAQTLIIIGDKGVVTSEHAIAMHKQIAGSELAIIPGVHGEYIGEITTIKPNSKAKNYVIPMIENFLDKSESRKCTLVYQMCKIFSFILPILALKFLQTSTSPIDCCIT